MNATSLDDRLVQRALLLTSQVLGRVIDEGEYLSPAGVHSVRVAIKRLRAGWRLLAPSLPLQAAQADTRLRTLHHELAGDRSRFVRLATLERVCAEGDAAGDGADLRAAMLELQASAPFTAGGEGISSRGFADSVGRTFRAESRAWRELGPAVRDADLLPALRDAYRSMRRAAKRARRRDPESLHRWRLRLKRVLHQAELVAAPPLSANDGAEDEVVAGWRALAEQLGRLQDLEDLRCTIVAASPHARIQALVLPRIEAQQRRAFRKVKAARDRVLALRPRAFVARLAATGAIASASSAAPDATAEVPRHGVEPEGGDPAVECSGGDAR